MGRFTFLKKCYYEPPYKALIGFPLNNLGTQGRAGLPGPMGMRGPTGATGSEGRTGATGPRGNSGPFGPTGKYLLLYSNLRW